MAQPQELDLVAPVHENQADAQRRARRGGDEEEGIVWVLVFRRGARCYFARRIADNHLHARTRAHAQVEEFNKLKEEFDKLTKLQKELEGQNVTLLQQKNDIFLQLQAEQVSLTDVEERVAKLVTEKGAFFAYSLIFLRLGCSTIASFLISHQTHHSSIT